MTQYDYFSSIPNSLNDILKEYKRILQLHSKDYVVFLLFIKDCHVFFLAFPQMFYIKQLGLYVIILYVYIIDEYCDLLNWTQVKTSVNKK